MLYSWGIEFILFCTRMQESRALQYILGASLLMIALFAISSFVMINSQADSSTASATISPNSSPTVSTKFISSTSNGGNDALNLAADFTLAAGTTSTVWVNGLVADNNGDADIASVAVTLYRTTTSGGAACSADNNDCYTNAACTLDAAAGTTLQTGYNCSFSLEYYTDSTVTGGVAPSDTWYLSVTATDLSSNTGSDATYTKEMPLVTSLTIPGAISYGSLALGTSTTNATNTSLTLTQQGNDQADVEVSMAGPSLDCITGATATGAIARASISWAITDTDVAGSTALTSSAVDTNNSVGYRTGAVVTDELYWNIVIPATGVGGTCSGTVTVSTIPA